MRRHTTCVFVMRVMEHQAIFAGCVIAICTKTGNEYPPGLPIVGVLFVTLFFLLPTIENREHTASVLYIALTGLFQQPCIRTMQSICWARDGFTGSDRP